MKMKIKLWIEDKNNNLIFGDGKNEIMQSINKTGSTEETSKILNMSEEKIFNHLKIIEQNNEKDMILSIRGLKKNSKVSYILSPDARKFLQTYQIFQDDVRKFGQQRFKEIFVDDIK